MAIFLKDVSIEQAISLPCYLENLDRVYTSSMSDLLDQIWDYLPKNLKNILIWELDKIR